MSVLTDRHVLVVGASNEALERLLALLQTHDIKITNTDRAEVTPQLINEKGIDLVLVNLLDDTVTCEKVLDQLSTGDLQQLVPVFVLTENSATKIEAAFSDGATDYLTVDEDPASIIQKFEALFASSTEPASIDITPEKTEIHNRNIRVFVLEDDPLLRNLLAIRFERSGFPYEFSSDGSTAVAAIEQFKPDIVILDLMLPGCSGLDILASLKQHPQLQAVPVVVFSNRDGSEERAKAKSLGVAGFYVKAMTDLSELITMIESLVTDAKSVTPATADTSTN